MKTKISGTNLLFFIIFGFLISVMLPAMSANQTVAMGQSAGNPKQKEIFARLLKLEDKLYSQPESILDTLGTISEENLGRKSAAYFYLLRTIARERTGKISNSDSIIINSERWYRQTDDQKNLFRSLICKGIVKSSRLYTDSLSYISFIEAERILNRYSIDDPYCESLLYKHLGRINRHNQNYHAAEYYLKKGLDIAELNNDNKERYKLRIELFRTFLIQKHFSQALEIISGFADIDTLPPQTAYELYNEMSFYHSARGEFDISISYLNKILSMRDQVNFEPNELSSVYYRIAAFHNKYSNLDSSLHYNKLAALNANDTLDTRRHFYFKNLAETYASKGD
ncbi:MAG: hypothetical protein PHY21_09710, partial [Candidatus Cloacimonetes bacterium]|nr:hypothetical protein [Candidatus Cloacimonadota bacterium]